MPLHPTLRRWLIHLAWMVLFTVPLQFVLLRAYARSDHVVGLREKLADYLEAPERWNLLFLGDSRTYTDFDPDRIDPLLGTRSLNLAHWAHWFPTQYAQFAELVPRIPARTVVVWSVGEQNFRAVEARVNSSYPIRPWDLPRYVGWGYAVTTLQDNVASGVLDALPVHALRGPLRSFATGRLAGWLGTRPAPAPVAESVPAEPADRAAAGADDAARFAAEYRRIEARLRGDSTVARVRPWFDGGRITSAEVITRRGHYLRIEIDSLFFRARQRELAAQVVPMTAAYEPLPEYWNTFTGVLDLFRRHHVRLVVNLVEEAPYQYAPGENRAGTRAFVGRVRAEVERRGFPCVRVDWERFENPDYFDHNHLNQRGVARFTPMFAAALRPHLP